MAKVHTDFTSDGKQLLKTIQDSQKEIERLTNENRKLRDESKRAAKEAKEGFEDAGEAIEGAVTEISSMSAGLLSVQTLARMAAKEFDDWREKIDKTKESQSSFHEQLINSLRAAGQLARAEEIDKTLSSVSGATKEQMEASFAGISASGPVTVDKALELAEAMAPRAQSGESADKLREFGGVLGEMSDIAAGRTAQDVADLTAKLQELTRGDFNKFGGAGSVRALGKMTQGGMTVEDALGFAAAGMDVGVESKTIGQIAAKARAAGMTFEEAIADPRKANLGEKLESDLALIDLDVARKRADEFRQAEKDDLINRSVTDLLESQAGTMVRLRQHGEATFDSATPLKADATVEEIISHIDKGSQPYKGYFDRTIPAMEARFHVATGDLPAEAALKAYGGSVSPEYRAIHSDEENKFWAETVALLKNLVEQGKNSQQERPPIVVNPNAHVRP